MKETYHRIMLTAWLGAAAVAFKLGAVFMDWSITRKGKLNRAIDSRMNKLLGLTDEEAQFIEQHERLHDLFRKRDPGFVYADDEPNRYTKPYFWRTTPQGKVSWVDALPEECPLCGDPDNCKECK
jgi:hypothetical protein